MKPETLKTPVGELEGKRSLVDLLDGVEGMPGHHKTALVSRILKGVCIGARSLRPRRVKSRER